MKSCIFKTNVALILGIGLSAIGLIGFNINSITQAAVPHLANPVIWSVSGYSNILQSNVLRIHLEDHSHNDTYNIYLEDGNGLQYLICSNVSTDAQNRVDVDCPLAPANISPGIYDLYSTIFPSAGPRLATAAAQVEIVAGGTPQIVVEGGNVWAANETTQLSLLFHQTVDSPFEVKLFDGDGAFVENIAIGHSGSSTDTITWPAPDLAAMGNTVCNQSGGKTCAIKSFDKNGNPVAQTAVHINQPGIVLSNGPGPYKQGEVIYVYLRAHTPGKRYNIKFEATQIDPPGTPPSPVLYSTLDTNALGDTTNPIVWIIPSGCGSWTGWPDGLYKVTSQPLGQSTEIARLENIQLDTPAGSYLTVAGGYNWVAASFSNIYLYKHQPNHPYYLEFNSSRIPTQRFDDTFITNNCGHYVIDYMIPLVTVTGTYTIASFDAVTGLQQATQAITVSGLDLEVFYLPLILKN